MASKIFVFAQALQIVYPALCFSHQAVFLQWFHSLLLLGCALVFLFCRVVFSLHPVFGFRSNF
jgi:hypothetical protein